MVRGDFTPDLGKRYAESWPGERVYDGWSFIDQVEDEFLDSMKKLFHAEFVNVRPISGVANLKAYTAFTDSGKVIVSLSIPARGHITMEKKRKWRE